MGWISLAGLIRSASKFSRTAYRICSKTWKSSRMASTIALVRSLKCVFELGSMRSSRSTFKHRKRCSSAIKGKSSTIS